MAILIRKGGAGSGNFGHVGRPGKVGGSAKRGIIESGIEHAKATGEDIASTVSHALKSIDPWKVESSVVAKNIANLAGVDINIVLTSLHNWTNASNGRRTRQFQRVVADLFSEKGTHLSDWQKKLYARYTNRAEYEELYTKNLDNNRKIATAIYEETQKYFTENNIDGMYLFRGELLREKNGHTDNLFGHPVAIDDANALESWTTDPRIAIGFAPRLGKDGSGFSILNQGAYGNDVGVIYQAWVPRERIFSMSNVGMGMKYEREAIVLNSNQTDYVDAVAVFDARADESNAVEMTDYMKTVYEKYLG